MVSGDEDATKANSHQNLSRRAAKKARRKQEKAEKKRKALEAFLPDANNDSNNHILDKIAISNAPSVGGKAARARVARQKFDGTVANIHSISDGTEWAQHRPQAGAPILSQILPQHVKVVEYLESKEQEMRIKGRGVQMKERKVVKVDCHGTMDIAPRDDIGAENDNEHCNLSRLHLGGNFSLSSLTSLVVPPRACSLSTILHLDLSRNELWDISTGALEKLSATLITLDISRNWFESLPKSIGALHMLKVLRASHNLLKPNTLKMNALTSNMKYLEMIDLRFNQNCGRRSLLESLQSLVGDKVDVKLTVTYPPPPSDPTTVNGDRVGASPAVRDAKLLRSQLEPWSTMALRRRLVADFGEELMEDGRSWADADVTRGHVMDRLLSMYYEETVDKSVSEICTDENGRAVVCVSGALVEESIRDKVLHALKEFWATAESSMGARERPSISAENYMILCSPLMFEAGSKKAAKAAGKLKRHQGIWDLALEAMKSVDPVYASQYTAVAVTHNFVGSPHIDKQNVGPFYGFAVGDFEDGTGNIMAECSARVVAAINTKNRMAKVDGRFPHWVGPYDSKTDRYSLIYYRTEGEPEPIGPVVFDVPTDAYTRTTKELDPPVKESTA
mmetsp:Transcript_36109/g.77870  ORF Transcript_36109/g.77870 Transcript_36109/m.77870 type:complete len:620 (-) Transcript_36109:616-2475(-)